MSSRSYGQYCALAKALDAVGERWTLLIVRELLDGPKRYTDLLEGIPGIATDMLASRLRDLEAKGLVRRRELAPPAASAVYELTRLGEGLRPAVASFAGWGMQLMGARRGDEFRPRWMSLPLRAMFRPERVRGATLTAQFRLGADRFHVRIDDGRLETGEGEADAPDVIVETRIETLVALARGDLDPGAAMASRKTKVTGSSEAIGHLLEAFGFGVPAERSAASG